MPKTSARNWIGNHRGRWTSSNSLVTARFSDENPEAPFVEYLSALFSKNPLDVIVSIGAPLQTSCSGTGNDFSLPLRWCSRQ